MNEQSKSISSFNDWMVVYVASSEPEAYIVAGRLQSEGIPTFVHQEPVGRAYGFSVGPLGEVKVLVNPEDYDQAVAILDADAYESDETDLAPEDDDE
jgi:hypothetical protein